MKLSDFEWQVMRFFWEHEGGSAPEVHQWVTQDKEVTYSTVKTIIDRLEAKGAIERVKSMGRSIKYAAVVGEEKLAKPFFKTFFSNALGKKPKTLMNFLFEEEDLSMDDLAYLESLIEEKRKHKNG